MELDGGRQGLDLIHHYALRGFIKAVEREMREGVRCVSVSDSLYLLSRECESLELSAPLTSTAHVHVHTHIHVHTLYYREADDQQGARCVWAVWRGCPPHSPHGDA